MNLQEYKAWGWIHFLRITLTGFVIYKIFLETGPWTAGALVLVTLALELMGCNWRKR